MRLSPIFGGVAGSLVFTEIVFLRFLVIRFQQKPLEPSGLAWNRWLGDIIFTGGAMVFLLVLLGIVAMVWRDEAQWEREKR